jgi:hypothetical protein
MNMSELEEDVESVEPWDYFSWSQYCSSNWIMNIRTYYKNNATIIMDLQQTKHG